MNFIKINYLFILLSNLIFSNNYLFNENIRITESYNDQKFPEIAINDNIINLTWVSINGFNKNIIYSKSNDFGETFSIPIQINYVNNNIIAYGQSGPKINVFNDNIYISYTDNRTGYTSIYLNISNDNGNNWNEEILISDTQYLNAYQDLKIDNEGNLHLVYFNYAANNHLADVRYRFLEYGNAEFNNSLPLGVVNDNMEPCDCCQPSLEIDLNGDIYVIYRNNITNIRDTYIAIKRNYNNNFSEYIQVSNIQDYIGFCPSSGPSMDINNGQMAIAYTSYNDENIYLSISNLDSLDFSNFYNVNTNFNSFQNYPYILLEENLHAVWVDLNGYDIFYGTKTNGENEIINTQKLNYNNIESIQNDPVIYYNNEILYSFWSDQRHGNYEIYFCKAINQNVILGDINFDNIINISDIVILIRFIINQNISSGSESIITDLNSDGIINIQDLIILINLVLNY